MNDKLCKGCDERKPIEDFYRDKKGYVRGKCRKCASADSVASQKRTREAIGDVAWKRRKAAYMRTFRGTHGNDNGRQRNKARGRALTRLAERHADEYRILLSQELEAVRNELRESA